MIDTKELIEDLRRNPEFDEAHYFVDLVRKAGDVLERMRERKGLSQSQMAARLDITPGRISQLESGTVRNAPSLKTLAQYARHCGEEIEIAPASERKVATEAGCNFSTEMLSAILTHIDSLQAEIRELRRELDTQRSSEPGMRKAKAFIPADELQSWRHGTTYHSAEPEMAAPAKIVETGIEEVEIAEAFVELDADILHGVELATKGVIQVAGHKVEVSAIRPRNPNQIELTVKPIEGVKR